MADFWIGLDLGQLTDPTAASVVRRSLAIGANGWPVRNTAGFPFYRFDVLAIKRYQLGTPYISIVSHITDQLRRPEISSRQPRLVIDATGVGNPVVEMFRSALKTRPEIEAHAITITAGRSWSKTARYDWHVAKLELVAAIREALESERLKVPPKIEHAATLRRELSDFRVKISPAANEIFSAREGAHDDLVLATALPVWVANQRVMEMVIDENDAPHEFAAIAAEQQALEAAEREAVRLEKEGERAKRHSEFMDIDNEFWWK
jgi:hypothetical protein